MFRNYFKTAFRNLVRNRNYAVITILGLAVGITASLLIFLVVRYETSFDDFHKKKNSIYRVSSEFHNQDGVAYLGDVSFPVAAQLRLDFPQLKEVASIFRKGQAQVAVDDQTGNRQKKFLEDNIFYAEPEFFKIFDFGWLAGDITALSEPNSVVLTQDVADKYFGTWQNALGKSIQHDNKYLYKVTGILKNMPANTDFPLDIVISYTTLKNTEFKESLHDWIGTYQGAYTFVVLPQAFTQDKFNNDLKIFSKKHKSAEDANDLFVAQSLSEMHYDSRFGNYRNHTFSHELVNALALIGIFLIIVACVNFINLATAQAINRSKEVGVRKVLGSSRSQLTFQFLGETILLTTIAVITSIILTAIALPFLNRLLETRITLNFVTDPLALLFIAALIIAVSILSGLYPAIILSGFNPVTALKNKFASKTTGGISLRRILVILQFAIAQTLTIIMLIVVSQMNYFKNASLGFDKSAVVTCPIPSDSVGHSKIDHLRNSLLTNPGISDISFSYATPSSNDNWTSSFLFDHTTKPTDFSANLKWADADYFKTYKMGLVAGRLYYPSDTIREIVVNEVLAKKLGIGNPKDILGKEIRFGDNGPGIPVVGVVRDFNAKSLKEPMAPVLLSSWKDVYQVANIKLKPGAEKSTLAFVEKLWNKTFPDNVFQYHFLDDTIAAFYKQENELSLLYAIFAGIAIFVSCLGLYGLISFMTVQRTKEIGVRKVLGAPVRSIVYLLSKEFTILIIISFAIAAPVGYYFMYQWLQQYTYRIQLGVLIFLLAAAVSVLVAWITVGHRTISAALANPVKSLRTE